MDNTLNKIYFTNFSK